MIDYFSLVLTHALTVIALIRLLSRDDLDSDTPDRDGRRKPVARRTRPGGEQRDGRETAG
ncbi:MAG: hypothetical protein IE933_14150 [Sphingomonadales bacterium]|nr:hypothetical protein [Sphingomonadales bacterium]MBD3774485.1 hypothetical protein [Paracoccaceae bacterium]